MSTKMSEGERKAFYREWQRCGMVGNRGDAENLWRAACAWQKARDAGIVQEAREDGETDLRSVMARIKSD